MNIYGVHDAGLEHVFTEQGVNGYVVITRALGQDPDDHSGDDFSGYRAVGLKVLLRLNHGYKVGEDWQGTIPPPEHREHALMRLVNYCSASNLAAVQAIGLGNEPNIVWERPDQKPITPAVYGDWYVPAERAIHAIPGLLTMPVCPAAVGPWNVDTKYNVNPSGDWVTYFADLISELTHRGARVDGLWLHSYTHGHEPRLIDDPVKMDPPFDHRHYHFLVTADWLANVPMGLRDRPVYITEFNPGDERWRNENNGYVQAAYRWVNDWNTVGNNQQIHALCLYCVEQREDGMSFRDKPGVIEDLRRAMDKAYALREDQPMAFDGSFSGAVVEQGGISQLKMISPWRVQWRPAPPGTEDGYLYRPEADKITETKYLPPGASAVQKIWTNYATHDAAIIQGPISVAKGALVRFEINAWQQTSNPHNHGYAQVGIDPTGGTDMLADTVEWGETSIQQYERHVRLAAEAIAQTSRITLFARAAWQYKEEWCDTFWSLATLETDAPEPEPGPGEGQTIRIVIYLDGEIEADLTYQAVAGDAKIERVAVSVVAEQSSLWMRLKRFVRRSLS